MGDVSGDGAEGRVVLIFGVYSDDEIQNFENSGTISVSAVGGNNVSMNDISAIWVEGKSSLINTGNVLTTVKVGANSAVSDVSGIFLDDADDSIINNTGLIYVGVDPFAVVGPVTVVDRVAGIFVSDSDNVTIYSPGRIHLYTDVPDANLRTLWLSSSAVTFDRAFGIAFGDPGITKRPIYLEGGSLLNLNGSTLVAYAGRDLRFNRPYYLIERDNATSDEVTGRFGGLKKGSRNPDLTVSWFGPARGEDDPEGVAVVWNYNPKESSADASVHAAFAVMQNIRGLLTTHLMYKKLTWWLSQKDSKVLLADSGQIKSDVGAGVGIVGKRAKTGAFFMPVYTDVEADDIGYDAHAHGFIMGLEREIYNSLVAGVFGGISRSEVKFNEYESGGIEDDQDIYHLGVYANYGYGRWYGSLVLMGYAVQHDYVGRTGPEFEMKETADYWSHGLESEFVVGYGFGNMKSWMVMPELGIGYSYWRVSDFKTDAEYSAWDKYYEGEDDSYFRSIVGLTGVKRWLAKDVKVDLLASVRWEQALGDNDISITQSLDKLGSSKREVEEEIGDTSIIGRVGLSLTFKERLKLNITFRSEFNEDYTVYSGRASIGISF